VIVEQSELHSLIDAISEMRNLAADGRAMMNIGSASQSPMSDTGLEDFRQELSRLVDAFHKNFSHYKDEGYVESALRKFVRAS
jgi:hypothetical protein